MHNCFVIMVIMVLCLINLELQKQQHPHLSGLRLAVSKPRNEVLTVATGERIRQLVAHQFTGLLHNDMRFARLILIIQKVVDLKRIAANNFPDVLTPHSGSVAVQEKPQAANRVSIPSWGGFHKREKS